MNSFYTVQNAVVELSGNVYHVNFADKRGGIKAWTRPGTCKAQGSVGRPLTKAEQAEARRERNSKVRV